MRFSSSPSARQSLEARVPTEHRLGDLLGDPVAGRVVEAEDPGRVAGGRAGRHLAEGDDLRHRLAPVLLGHVADHPLATADREVDVDVRHRLARRVEETLEEQLVGERVEVRDVEAVGDDRARRGAAPRADGDAVVLGVPDEVPDDQEVGVEAHLRDHRELELEPLASLRGGRIAVATRAGPRWRAVAASRPAPRPRASGSAAGGAAPSSISTSQRSAISSVVGTASGQRENDSLISAGLLRKNSLVSKRSFGCSIVDLVCTHRSAAWFE